MRSYSQFLDDERDQIAILRAVWRSMGAIARALGRAKTTISRELQRNALSSGGYSPLHAAGAYQLRRRREAILEREAPLRLFVRDARTDLRLVEIRQRTAATRHRLRDNLRLHLSNRDCQEPCVRGHSDVDGGRIKKDTMDGLLAGRDPQAVFAKDGLFDERTPCSNRTGCVKFMPATPISAFQYQAGHPLTATALLFTSGSFNQDLEKRCQKFPSQWQRTMGNVI